MDQTFREALCAHELFRRLGFLPEEIFITVNTPLLDVLIVVRADNLQFGLAVGRTKLEPDAFYSEWKQIALRFNEGLVDIDYDSSWCFRQRLAIVRALVNKGLIIRDISGLDILTAVSQDTLSALVSAEKDNSLQWN